MAKAYLHGPSHWPLTEKVHVPYYVVGKQDWLEGAFEPGALPRDRVICVEGDNQLEAVRADLRRMPFHGIDTEATGLSKLDGLNPYNSNSRLLLLQMGNKEKVFIIQPELVTQFKSIMEDAKYLHLGQNIVFDFKFLLARYGVHLVRLYDTMIAEQLLVAGLMGARVGLEDLARKYFPHYIISKDTRKKFVDFQGKFDAEMLYYAGQDVVLMFPVMEAQVPELQKWKMEKIAKIEFLCLMATAEMELTGVKINERKLRLALSYHVMRQQELEGKIQKAVTAELRKQGKVKVGLLGEMEQVFNLKSGPEKLEMLKSIGFDLEDVQRNTLKELGTDIAKWLGEWSAEEKFVTTYGEGMLARITEATGKLHPRFSQLGMGDLEVKSGRQNKAAIATGRYSSDFQQLPKPKKKYAAVTDPAEQQLVRALFGDKMAELNIPLELLCHANERSSPLSL